MTYRYRLATVFLMGFFVDCINIFMPAVALPTIAAEFHVGISAGAWVANAYMLGLTLAIPLAPWLADRWGVRRLMAGSMLAFALAAWACGEAGSFGQLVGWRFIQGMAGGLVIPVGQALAFNRFQGPERARVSTLVMAVALIAPALSPWLGGLIVDHGSWRWVFHSNIALALAAAGLAWLWVCDAPATARQRPDLKGLVLVSATLAAWLLGMSLYGAGQGSGQGLALAWLGMAAGLAFTVLYAIHARKTAHPIVELQLLKSPRLRMSVAVYHAIPGVFTGVNLLNIFYLQDMLHLSAQATGRFMMVYAGGALVSMLVGGRLYNRAGARPLFIASMVLHSLGIAALAAVAAPADAWLLVAAYGLMGLGGGLGANTAQTTALLDFDGRQTQQASVIWNLNRQMAFSVGAAFFLMVFNTLATRLDAGRAYHMTFLIASLAGLVPLLQLRSLHTLKDHHARQQAHRP
ncbi:MFS transporter [Delftia acidovorans]|uniref:MFS transporter n=1 Tax=Delftia acidovorans TaxID=80866 RepID=UPI0022ABB55D|nr:MFS transporter [Delftia acidovorans]WAT85982.1 MFS transporter [Delftia acidovorans]